jgi:hypothetical protein
VGLGVRFSFVSSSIFASCPAASFHYVHLLHLLEINNQGNHEYFYALRLAIFYLRIIRNSLVTTSSAFLRHVVNWHRKLSRAVEKTKPSFL